MFREDVISGIEDQLAEASETLFLARNGQWVSVTGFHGNPERSVSQGEAAIGVRETSFVIRAADYAPMGVVSEPRIGDRITRDSGTVFEVCRPESGLNHCEDFGGVGYAWRVQVAKVST